MFERFTDRARATVVLAQEEAREFGHNYIGTEHLLLGLLREPEGVASVVLRRLGIGLSEMRADVRSAIGTGNSEPVGHIPFTGRAKKVLELSLREALQLGHNYIGTEHILLGLVREGEGVAAQLLVARGLELDRLREAVVTELKRIGAKTGGSTSGSPRTPAADDAVSAAEELAQSAPVGSHHLLEALARSEDSLAARVLAALGVDPDAIAAKIDELGIEDTTDLTPEEAAARRMELRLEGNELHVVLRDETTVELFRSVAAHLGSPVRGDDPATSFVALRTGIVSELESMLQRVAPVPEPAPAGESIRSMVVRRAMQSRLRRRGAPGRE